MTKFDVLALGMILLTTIIATMRGLVGEVASLLSWVVSFMMAKLFARQLADIAFNVSNVDYYKFAVSGIGWSQSFSWCLFWCC